MAAEEQDTPVEMTVAQLSEHDRALARRAYRAGLAKGRQQEGAGEDEPHREQPMKAPEPREIPAAMLFHIGGSQPWREPEPGEQPSILGGAPVDKAAQDRAYAAFHRSPAPRAPEPAERPEPSTIRLEE